MKISGKVVVGIVGDSRKFTEHSYTPCPAKRGHGFFPHNFNKCRHSFVIFGVNNREDYFSKNIENLFLILSHHYVV